MAMCSLLVRAARKERHQHHEVGKREEPLIRLLPRSLSRARDEAQVPAFREVTDVVHANPSQVGNFRVRENFLARLDGNHGLFPLTAWAHLPTTPVMLPIPYKMQTLQSNSSSVSYL